MPTIFAILLLFSLCYIGWRRSLKSPLSTYYWAGLLLKVTAGFALGLVYTYFYPVGDTWDFHQGGLKWIELAAWHELLGQLAGFSSIPQEVLDQHHTGDHRSMRMYWIAALLMKLFSENYWVLSAVFSVYCFSGIWRLLNAGIRYLNAPKWAMVIAFFLCPGVLFWSSGLLKEALLLGSIGWVVSFMLEWRFSKVMPKSAWEGVLQLSFVALSIWIILQLKYYYFAVLFVCLGSWVLIDIITLQYAFLRKNMGLLLLAAVFILGVAVKIGQQAYPLLSTDQIFQSIYDNYLLLSSTPPDPKRQIILPDLAPTPLGVLQSIPQALVEGLLRPYAWEGGHVFKLLNSLDGLLLIIGLTGMVGSKRFFPHAYRQQWLGLFVALYILTLGSLLAMAAPNLGALARYRVGYTPFLLAYFLTMGRLFWARIYRRASNY